MSTSSTPRRLSLPHRIVSKAFQKLWRLTRGHILRAEAFVRDEDGRILVTEAGALPGTQVNRGEAAEEALRRSLHLGFGLVEPDVTLLAVTHVPSQGARASSTYIAIFDVTWNGGQSVPDTFSFADLETLERVLPAELLTLARRRAIERRMPRPM